MQGDRFPDLLRACDVKLSHGRHASTFAIWTKLLRSTLAHGLHGPVICKRWQFVHPEVLPLAQQHWWASKIDILQQLKHPYQSIVPRSSAMHLHRGMEVRSLIHRQFMSSVRVWYPFPLQIAPVGQPCSRVCLTFAEHVAWRHFLLKAYFKQVIAFGTNGSARREGIGRSPE